MNNPIKIEYKINELWGRNPIVVKFLFQYHSQLHTIYPDDICFKELKNILINKSNKIALLNIKSTNGILHYAAYALINNIHMKLTTQIL